jgi:hypothetical protein
MPRPAFFGRRNGFKAPGVLGEQEELQVSEEEVSERVYLQRIARDMQTVKQMLAEVVNYMKEAEKEVSEKMRRFVMYMHDVHDIVNLYVEGGHEVPRYVMEEMERCDDRYRQLLEEAHTDGGTFEKVRRDMSSDPKNRWDHTRLLTKGKPDEDAGQSRPNGP